MKKVILFLSLVAVLAVNQIQAMADTDFMRQLGEALGGVLGEGTLVDFMKLGETDDVSVARAEIRRLTEQAYEGGRDNARGLAGLFKDQYDIIRGGDVDAGELKLIETYFVQTVLPAEYYGAVGDDTAKKAAASAAKEAVKGVLTGDIYAFVRTAMDEKHTEGYAVLSDGSEGVIRAISALVLTSKTERDTAIALCEKRTLALTVRLADAVRRTHQQQAEAAKKTAAAVGARVQKGFGDAF